MSAANIVLALSAFLSMQCAHACMPGKNIDVYFASNSSVVTASEMLRLANWMVDQRIKYPRQKAITAGGYAEEGERSPKSLAAERLHAVARTLKATNFNQVPVQEHFGVYRPGDVSNGRRVEISLLPACPDECCGPSGK